jgi:hypothetical protein
VVYQRHPKGYDGIRSTSRPLNGLLAGALARLDSARSKNPQQVLQVWPSIVGPQMAPFTKANRFEEGTLYVTVTNSMVYSLLAGSEKIHLLETLKQKMPDSGVQNIVFRLG